MGEEYRVSVEAQEVIAETKLQIEKEKRSFLITIIVVVVIFCGLMIWDRSHLSNIYLIVGGVLIVLGGYWKILLLKSKIKSRIVEDRAEHQKMMNQEYYHKFLMDRYGESELYDDLCALYGEQYVAKGYEKDRKLLEEMFEISKHLLTTEHFGIVYYLQNYSRDLFYLVCDYDGTIDKVLHKALYLIDYDYCKRAKDSFLMESTLKELKKVHNWNDEIQQLDGRM